MWLIAAFLCCKVLILNLPYQIDREFDYYIPSDLHKNACAGVFAAVPFGNSNRGETALITKVYEGETEGLKAVKAIMEDGLKLSAEQLKIIAFLREHTYCSSGDAIKAILPSGSFADMDVFYLPSGKGTEKFTDEKERSLFEYITEFGRVSGKEIVKDFGEYSSHLISSLLKKSLITRDFDFHEKKSTRYIKYLRVTSLADAYISGEKNLRSEKMLDTLRFICECGIISLPRLRAECEVSSAQVSSLEKKGLIEVESVDCYRDPYADGENNRSDKKLELSEQQAKARNELLSLYSTGEPRAALLHGITGSGKTSVIIAMTDEVLKSGRQVIILVPEIALTPQALSVFGSYYKDNIVLMHSSLSKGERYDAYKKMEEGIVNVCIGTRTAIFAPFKNIGMIVIDEEQEHTYKSEQNPKFNAIDVARFRCAVHNSLMLLASATPSVTSYYRAQKGRYKLIELTERYGNATLPECEIFDMREDFNKGSLDCIGSKLKNEIQATLERGEQAVLFLNRRGYSNYASCPKCGEVVMCPRCSVSLTRHNYRFCAKLICHYCGYSIRLPEKCPSCGGEHLRYLGYGTQMVEEELKRLFPDKKILRMDADTVSHKLDYERTVSAFKNHEADILLGTQMVTKGHDFPDVTLSGVLLADMSLYLDDYRAGERTFSLLTQVSGRAGRASKPGKAVIQSFNPEHPIIKLVQEQDYKSFYKNEISLRKTLLFPPFCDIFLITVTSSSEDVCVEECRNFFNRMKAVQEKNPGLTLVVFGPFEAPIYKINDKFRWRYVIKGRNNKLTRQAFSYLIKEAIGKSKGRYSVSIDVNPNSL